MMDEVRRVVWDQVRSSKVQVTQKGQVREWDDRENVKGPIRVRRGEQWDEQ